MITDKMSIEEVQQEVFKLYPIIRVRAQSFTEAFRHKVRKSLTGKPKVWLHYDTIKIDNNIILLYYSSRKGTYSDFASVYFLQINNSAGYKEFYRILVGGLVQKITKHFIDRFVERTGCPKEHFLAYFTKEFLPVSAMEMDKEGYTYLRSTNGLAVIYNNNILITYLNDLSNYKQSIKEEMDELGRKAGKFNLTSSYINPGIPVVHKDLLT